MNALNLLKLIVTLLVSLSYQRLLSCHISSQHQLANLFAKALPKSCHHYPLRRNVKWHGPARLDFRGSGSHCNIHLSFQGPNCIYLQGIQPYIMRQQSIPMGWDHFIHSHRCSLYPSLIMFTSCNKYTHIGLGVSQTNTYWIRGWSSITVIGWSNPWS